MAQIKAKGEKMGKLSQKEIEEALDNAAGIASYRMYTDTGFHLYMKMANFYYNHYNAFIKIVIQIPLFFIDTIDFVVFFFERKK